MAEPSTTGIVVAGAIGAGLMINGEAAIGALCGGVLYFVANAELSIPSRIALSLVSVVMGYMAAPMLAGMTLFGVGPIDLPGPAAFVASSSVVTATLAAIKAKRASVATKGETDG
ncbi:putative holin [Azotobacter salinestris]|uniref:putative holin n=1 Tax=Azotobacter salinestris TaxID=69964 RepID=UPI0032DE906E